MKGECGVDYPWQIIGIIDSHGAIHHRELFLHTTDLMHESYWLHRHKRWRFDLKEWGFESTLGGLEITETEIDDVLAFLRQRYTPPDWWLENEAWEKAGRPTGKKYETWLGKFRKSKQQQNGKSKHRKARI